MSRFAVFKHMHERLEVKAHHYTRQGNFFHFWPGSDNEFDKSTPVLSVAIDDDERHSGSLQGVRAIEWLDPPREGQRRFEVIYRYGRARKADPARSADLQASIEDHQEVVDADEYGVTDGWVYFRIVPNVKDDQVAYYPPRLALLADGVEQIRLLIDSPSEAPDVTTS